MALNLKEIYNILNLRREVVESAFSWGVLGPLVLGDEKATPRYGFTDAVIGDIRKGGEARKEYNNSKLTLAGIPDLRGEADEKIMLSTLREEGMIDARRENDLFGLIADMMVLARAGVLKCENYSESTDLCRWRINPEFESVMPANTHGRMMTYVFLDTSIREKNPDLTKVDQVVTRYWNR